MTQYSSFSARIGVFFAFGPELCCLHHEHSALLSRRKTTAHVRRGQDQLLVLLDTDSLGPVILTNVTITATLTK